MAGDLKVSTSAKATILTENDDVPGSNANLQIILLNNLNAGLTVGGLNRQEKGKTWLHV